jgi:BirA family biotin operon repressor/biotin-[acetyl-CoA-carboxylase] ligase
MVPRQRSTPWHVLQLGETLSTSATLKRLAAWGAGHGTVVMAQHQAAGQGRTGRHWLSPPGALLLSALLRPDRPQPLLSLLVGVAAAEAVGLPDLHLKWPNDLLIGDDKCGGILVEGRWAGDRPEYLIVGIGVNVAAAPALSGTTCLQAHGSSLDAQELAGRLLDRLDHWLAEPEPTALLAAWRARCRMWGRELTVFPPGAAPWTAVAEDLADDGALVVRTASGAQRRLQSGEVRLTGAEARRPL